MSLFKSVRLLRLFQAARRLDQNYEKSVSLLFLMMFAFTLFAHWLACIFYAIGFNESKSEDPNSWLTILAEQSNPFDKVGRVLSLRTRYLTALYFTLTCLTSVGFGNVAANTDYEKLFTIVSMLIGGKFFSIFYNAGQTWIRVVPYSCLFLFKGILSCFNKSSKMLFEHRLGVLHSRKTMLCSCKSTNRVFVKAIFTFEFPGAAILKCDVLLLQCQAPSRYLTLY